MATTSRAKEAIVGLDLLRFLAALVVVLHHLGLRASRLDAAESGHLFSFAWFGWIGVPIFFVISGFVIPYTAQRATLRSFAISRAIRLLPAAWVCSTITALDLILTRSRPEFTPNLAMGWLHSITLFPLGPWVDGAYWTLSVELAFYIFIAALLAIRRFNWVSQLMQTIGVVSSTSWILIALHREGLVNASWVMAFATKAAHSRTGLFLLTQHGCYFALGTLFWLVHFDRVTARRSLLIAYCLLGASCDIVMNSLATLGGRATGRQTPLIPLALWLLAVLALTLATRYNARLQSFLGQRGSARIRTLGLITYPLYLIHQQNGYIWLHLLQGITPDLFNLGAVVVAVLLLSYLVTRFAEQPLQLWLRQLLSPRHDAPLVTSPPIAATLP